MKNESGVLEEAGQATKEQQILDGLKPVCLCKGIRKKEFLKLIHSGLTTVQELQKATGSGSGSCKGKRCTPRIAEMLKDKERL